MKKRILPLYILLLTSIGTKAQCLQEMFTNTPAEQTPYLDKTMREELLKFADSNKDTCSLVANALATQAWISTISNNLIILHPNEVVTEEYRLLPNESKTDSVLCLIRTYNAPEQESTITLYDRKWNEINKIDVQSIAGQTLKAKPDTMSESEYEDLKQSINFTMTKASFVKNEDAEVELTPTTPLMTEEDKSKLKSLKLQTIVKWNGKTFN